MKDPDLFRSPALRLLASLEAPQRQHPENVDPDKSSHIEGSRVARTINVRYRYGTYNILWLLSWKCISNYFWGFSTLKIKFTGQNVPPSRVEILPGSDTALWGIISLPAVTHLSLLTPKIRTNPATAIPPTNKVAFPTRDPFSASKCRCLYYGTVPLVHSPEISSLVS